MRGTVRWPTRDVLAHRAATTPERTAVVDVATGREWTYRAFDAVVDDVAAQLSSLLEDDGRARVGLLASTRVGFFTTVHAAMRDGDAVVALDAKLTAGELGARLDRADPELLVCEAPTEERALSVAEWPVVSLDEPEDSRVGRLRIERPDGSESVDPARWDRGETAVVLFTSGTTGEPKGVELTLGNLVASATASAFRLGTAPGDRWLCCLPAYHMGGLAPGFRAPLYGTTLLVEESFDATAAAEALAGFDATGVSLVPTQLTRLLDAGWAPPGSLEAVLLGGAPASQSLIERALDAGVPVYPTYGLTEAASQVATATPEQLRDHPGTVGQPLVVTDVTVVDDGAPVPAGETGELVVDGPTVTPGYLDDDLTRQATGEHGLHTGDVGYRDADGRLWVLGRADDRIVTGGENVHPSEVRSALRSHPDVADAAVVGLPDEEWGQRVGALVVPADSDRLPDDLDAFLRDRLASYKLPKTVRAARELPRTASGTVDRGAVRDRLRE